MYVSAPSLKGRPRKKKSLTRSDSDSYETSSDISTPGGKRDVLVGRFLSFKYWVEPCLWVSQMSLWYKVIKSTPSYSLSYRKYQYLINDAILDTLVHALVNSVKLEFLLLVAWNLIAKISVIQAQIPSMIWLSSDVDLSVSCSIHVCLPVYMYSL